MTLKEAKDILKKEFAVIGLHKSPEPFEFDDSNWFWYEKPAVLEAFRVLAKEGYYVTISRHDYDMRKKRLQKEYEQNTKSPGSGEEQPEEGNPALKESASQFNDALLDEQAKEIECLKNENEDWKSWHEMQNRQIALSNIAFRNEKNRLGKEIARLNKIIRKKNLKIEELGKESSRHLEGKIKMFGENVDLEQMLKDKDAVLSDVAEELRLSKIREKNLTEVSQKYMKENEELKKKLGAKIVDKIDAQALKSAESALAYKDEVIETLDKELAEAKHELSSLKRPFRPDSTEAVVLFANAYAKAERKHLPCTEWKNDGKEVSATYILENGKKSKIALDFTGDEIIFSRTDPDKPRKDSLYSYKDKQLAEKDEVIADLGNELAATKKELEEKTHLVEIVRNASKDYRDYGVAANEFIKKLANLYVTAGSKGTISNEMFERCKDYQSYGFPAKCKKKTKKEINDIASGKTKVVGADNAEEGGDHSGVIVLCGKDFVKKFKENEDLIHDLFEKKYKEIIEVMSVESKQLFEGDGIPTKMEAVKPSQRFKQSVCDARLELLYFIS